MIYLILPLNRNEVNNNSDTKLWYNIRITISILHTMTKRLEICIDINIEISWVDHYVWVFTSRIFILTLEITLSPNKHFFLQMA